MEFLRILLLTLCLLAFCHLVEGLRGGGRISVSRGSVNRRAKVPRLERKLSQRKPFQLPIPEKGIHHPHEYKTPINVQPRRHSYDPGYRQNHDQYVSKYTGKEGYNSIHYPAINEKPSVHLLPPRANDYTAPGNPLEKLVIKPNFADHLKKNPAPIGGRVPPDGQRTFKNSDIEYSRQLPENPGYRYVSRLSGSGHRDDRIEGFGFKADGRPVVMPVKSEHIYQHSDLGTRGQAPLQSTRDLLYPDKRPGDQMGHIRPRAEGGSGNVHNIFSQDGPFNQGPGARMEARVRQTLKDNPQNSVYVKHHFDVGAGGNQFRASGFKYQIESHKHGEHSVDSGYFKNGDF